MMNFGEALKVIRSEHQLGSMRDCSYPRHSLIIIQIRMPASCRRPLRIQIFRRITQHPLLFEGGQFLKIRTQENNMLNNASLSRLWRTLIASACIFLVSSGLCAKSCPMPKRSLKRQLLEAVEKVRNGKTSNSRTEAAEHLATLTRGINPHKVDETTLAEMVSLLDIQEDSVRAWVAASLGNLGPRARVAVPRLLKLLPEVDCLRGSLTSASAIRLALKRMGEAPPPNCDAKKEP